MGETLAGAMKKLGLKRQNLIFIAGLAGILLLAFAKLPALGRPAGTVAESQPDAAAGYEQQLEQRLEDILGSMSGVGRVRVMVTLESGYGYEYAKENKTGSDHLEDYRAEENQKTQEKSTAEESYVMVDAADGGKKPLVTKALEPKIQGVVVVCDGGDKAAVVGSIIETVGVAVNLSSAQISVSRMGPNIPGSE